VREITFQSSLAVLILQPLQQHGEGWFSVQIARMHDAQASLRKGL
jgi:hypothetical protein